VKQVKGGFEVNSTPFKTDEAMDTISAVRVKFEKRFSGPLTATSTVVMMGMMNKDLNSGAYVALEKVTGELNGKNGSFALQHSSRMTRGKPEQSITVVPDSGTEELEGLSGSMAIDIVEGEHFYTFAFELK